jgi:isoleucyl-tRNA synthetase
VRLSRGRFYEVESADNRAAFATLHEVLTVACRLLAPFCPFVTDWLHRELTGRTVHLAPYVRDGERHEDATLGTAMEELRRLVTLGRGARETAKVPVRQPLARMVCVVPQAHVDALAPLLPLLRDELNVKQVDFAGTADALVHLEAKANFRTLGKKFGKATPQAAAAVTALSSDALRAFEQGEPLSLTVEGTTRHLDPDDITILRRATGDLVVAEAAGYFAAIDPVITPALRREGIAREVVSRVQRLRKDAGFQISDRVRLRLSSSEEVEGAVRAHRDWIAGEVLAREVAVGDEGSLPGTSHDATAEFDLDGSTVRLALNREA